MSSNVWNQVLSRIETKVNRHSFYTWFRPTVFVEDSGEQVTIRVPNELFRDWLTKHYADVINEAATEVQRDGMQIAFVIDGQTGKAIERQEQKPPVAGVPAGVPSRGLNPRYLFETFVVGPSNQFAHAASLAVAEAPSRSYNPLYLYGGVGLGKTHLMHAIGQYLLAQTPDLRLVFRERYRTMDVLLVDDVQFLAGKEGTQTEFFHTFNSLYDAQKQIVISSDCPPHGIPALEERLRSRFEWGLIADIQPPDLETKIAILKKKAEAEAVPLADDVALYIAGRIKSNIRELEGSLIRLLAYASLTGTEISLTLAQDVLRNILDRDDQPVTIDQVQKFIANYYKLRVVDLKSRNNSKSITLPRQIAMFICKTLTNASLPQIGRTFGGKHHSTVIYSIRKIENLCKKDREFNKLVNSFLESFN